MPRCPALGHWGPPPKPSASGFGGERRRDGVSKPCPLGRGEGYKVRADEGRAAAAAVIGYSGLYDAPITGKGAGVYPGPLFFQPKEETMRTIEVARKLAETGRKEDAQKGVLSGPAENGHRSAGAHGTAGGRQLSLLLSMGPQASLYYFLSLSITRGIFRMKL